MLAPIAIFYVRDGQRFIQDFFSTNAHSNDYAVQSLGHRILQVVNTHFVRPKWFVFPLVVGLLVAHLYPRVVGLTKRQTLFIAFLGLFPCLVTIIVTNTAVSRMESILISGRPVWALYLVAFLSAIHLLLKQILGSEKFAVTAASLLFAALMFAHIKNFTSWQSLRASHSEELKVFVRRTQPYHDQNVTWLTGPKSALMGYLAATKN